MAEDAFSCPFVVAMTVFVGICAQGCAWRSQRPLSYFFRQDVSLDLVSLKELARPVILRMWIVTPRLNTLFTVVA